MAGSNRRPSQKQSGDAGRAGRTGRADQNPLTFSGDLDRRQEAWADEDMLAEDDPLASNPPRSTTSAIRFQPPTTGQRRGGTTRDVRTDMERVAQQPTRDVPAPIRRMGTVPAPDQQQMRAGAERRPARGVSPRAQIPSNTGRSGRSLHWLVYVGVGMVAALALWVSFSTILAWGTNKYDDLVYGYPRFFQTDAVVGHSDSAQHPSHFTALNLHGQVIVFELPGGNPSKSYEYIGPDLVANGDDLIPITLTFSDVNHNGKLDMIIHIEDREVIFCNNGTKFTQCSGS